MRVVVSGYYGFGNAGDEAVLAGMLRSFERTGTGPADFTVLSADPPATERDHGVHAAPRMDMARVRGALRDSDVFLSGGGSLFQDATSLRSVIYYAWIARMARRMGRPVVVYAQGVGPLRRRASRWLVRGVMESARYLSVRDCGSKALLRDIGVARDDIHVTADPAFALDRGTEAEAQRLLRDTGADTSRPLVGIAPRPWACADVTALVVSTAHHLADRGYGVVLLPMQVSQDGPICGSVGTPVLSGGFRSYLAACPALQGVLAMRLHALAFGAIAGVSIVGIAYDKKVYALMETLGQSDYVTGLNDARPEQLADSLERAIADTDARARLSEATERLRTEAYANAERVVRHLMLPI